MRVALRLRFVVGRVVYFYWLSVLLVIVMRGIRGMRGGYIRIGKGARACLAACYNLTFISLFMA